MNEPAPPASGDEMIRPARCWFCKQQMFYAEDERHEPEVRVQVHSDDKATMDEFFAHKRCWYVAINPDRKTEKPTGIIAPLSERERQIFQLIGEGNNTRTIANLLRLSIKTVEAHRANIKKKLDFRASNEIVVKAVEWVKSNAK